MKNRNKILYIILIFSLLTCKSNKNINPKNIDLDYGLIRKLAKKQFDKIDTTRSNETMWLLARYINEDFSSWSGRDTALAVIYRYSLINPKHESLKYLTAYPPGQELFELTYEILPECLDTIAGLSKCYFSTFRYKIGNYEISNDRKRNY